MRLNHHATHSLIVIGEPGPNTYGLDQLVALIINLGGDDLSRGLIGASSDEDHGNAAVIDLSENDTYEATLLELATGRLGVGLVVDHAGNDVYQLRLEEALTSSPVSVFCSTHRETTSVRECACPRELLLQD